MVEPVRVADLSQVTAISAANDRTCAIANGGQVYCWGSRDLGGDGDGKTEGDALKPVRVGTIENAISLSISLVQGAVVLADGSVWRWGTSKFVGGLNTATSPVRVSQLPPATAVSVGRNHACALLRDRTVRCWGSNVFGQLGQVTTDVRSEVPLPVPGLSNIKALSSGWFHTCALRNDGAPLCWGMDERLAAANEGQFNLAKSAANAVRQVWKAPATSTFGLLSMIHDAVEKVSANKRVLLLDTPQPRPIPEMQGATAIVSGPTGTCAGSSERGNHCFEVYRLQNPGGGRLLQ